MMTLQMRCHIQVQSHVGCTGNAWMRRSFLLDGDWDEQGVGEKNLRCLQVDRA